MDREKLIAEIMRECEADGEPITRLEAEEMADMEIKAKGIKNYAQAEKPKAKPKKERKVDTEKAEIIAPIVDLLITLGYTPSVRNEKYIDFGEYTLNLTRHRAPKN